eukprot:GHVH01003948.1.p1 GENE.GHVH01003948.1~~GHVH01003948.1.p1  ORF type:complete len:639 (+),score=88.93 GHVH01003948.1:1035-2951(+)
MENTRIAAQVYKMLEDFGFVKYSVTENLRMHEDNIAQGVSTRLLLRDQELMPDESQRAVRNLINFISLKSVLAECYRNNTTFSQTPSTVRASPALIPEGYQSMKATFDELNSMYSSEVDQLAHEMVSNAVHLLRSMRLTGEILQRLFVIEGAYDPHPYSGRILHRLINANIHPLMNGLDEDHTRLNDSQISIPYLESMSVKCCNTVDWVIQSLKLMKRKGKDLENQPWSLHPVPRAVIVDVGHNRTAINRIIKTTISRYPDHKLRICISLSGDRCPAEVLQDLPRIFPFEERSDTEPLSMFGLSGVHYIEGSHPRLLTRNEWKSSLVHSISDSNDTLALKDYLTQQLSLHDCYHYGGESYPPNPNDALISFTDILLPLVVEDFTKFQRPENLIATLLQDTIEEDSNRDLINDDDLDEQQDLSISSSSSSHAEGSFMSFSSDETEEGCGGFLEALVTELKMTGIQEPPVPTEKKKKKKRKHSVAAGASILNSGGGQDGTLETELFRAFALAAQDDDVLLIVGSFYMMSQVTRALSMNYLGISDFADENDSTVGGLEVLDDCLRCGTVKRPIDVFKNSNRLATYLNNKFSRAAAANDDDNSYKSFHNEIRLRKGWTGEPKEYNNKQQQEFNPYTPLQGDP